MSSMKTLRIALADDHELFREGIHLLLQKNKDVLVVAQAADGRELLRIVREQPIDLVITDIQMPGMDGIEATRRIREENPDTGIIALTMFEEDHLIVDMMEAGANGYVVKKAGKEELYMAISQVCNNQIYYCASTSLHLSKMLAVSKQLAQREEAARFSEKEKEIIQLICQEYASKQIAAETQLAHRTVEKYRDRIMQKTGARNVVGIVIYAIRNGIYKI